MKRLEDEAARRLYWVLTQLRTVEECEAFFEDLCTVKELQDMSKRLNAAVLLDRGMNYQEVSAGAGISSATICRVSKCLNYGSG